jgi:hypothetical protein
LFNVACRGLPKKRQKKAALANTETSIVVARQPVEMVYPPNEAVDNAVVQKRKRKSSSTSASSVKKSKSSSTSASSVKKSKSSSTSTST